LSQEPLRGSPWRRRVVKQSSSRIQNQEEHKEHKDLKVHKEEFRKCIYEFL
jgi:hypothetical protein